MRENPHLTAISSRIALAREPAQAAVLLTEYLIGLDEDRLFDFGHAMIAELAATRALLAQAERRLAALHDQRTHDFSMNSALADQDASGRRDGGVAAPDRNFATVNGRFEAGGKTGTVEPAAGPAESRLAAAGRHTPADDPAFGSPG